MHQAFTRAHVKLSFAFGLGHLMAETTGVVRFDHIQEKLGQIWNMVELTRSALVAAEAGCAAWTSAASGTRTSALRRAARRDAEVDAARERAPAADRRRRLHVHAVRGRHATARWPTTSTKYYQAAGADAERRIRLFRLAWDYLGSDLGGRGELYERFYLSDSFRMTALAYKIADKTRAVALVEQFLADD